MENAAANVLPPLDADALKARFKKRCADTNNEHQNWQIRVHRSLSWLKRAPQFGADQPEARFLFLWIALNSLYSRWNPEKNAPDADTAARQEFLRRVCEMNAGIVAATLHRHRGLVKKILADPFLSEVFWRSADDPKSKGRATEDENYLDRNLKNRDYARVLAQVIQRLFVLRGQIVHGASTGGSRLNRAAVRYSIMLLEIIVPVIQHIVIEQGSNEPWPELCYPPKS